MRLAVLGNSGSGKSTLACRVSQHFGAPCLDLDTVAWEPGTVAVPRAAPAARAEVVVFCSSNKDWVVEGCYASLIAAALPFGPHLVLLNPGEEQCLANCRERPWEPHKYASREDQDERLAFLLAWASAYYTREGDMSLTGHKTLYETFPGRKMELFGLPGLDQASRELFEWLS